MLTSKQRASLRSMANKIEAAYQIGKGAINENFIKQMNQALEARELIKVSVLESSLLSARQAAIIISEETGAEVVQVIGSRLVLYRRSKKPKIELGAL